jgi:TrmH family RNA methyltransferase
MEHITSRKNPLIAHIRSLLKDRSYRRETGEFVCDGVKLLEEAVKWGAALTCVISTEGMEVDVPEGCRSVEVPRDLMAALSPMKAPQGVLFTCAVPELSTPERLEAGTWLALEGLQDPGNVGTIWRSASAFDARGLLLLRGCADPYGWKAVRSSMGAVFRLPVWEVSAQELARLCRESGLPLWGTALREDTVDLRQLPEGPCVLAVGSEGRGLSEELLALCHRTVKIPMNPGCESLNAAMAATVALWERCRGKM